MKELFKILFYLLIIIVILSISIYLFMKTPTFGALPSGKSLEKVKNSKTISMVNLEIKKNRTIDKY